MNSGELTPQILSAAKRLDACQVELEERIGKAAKAAWFYDVCKSKAIQRCVGRGETVAERQALAEEVEFPDPETGEIMALSLIRYQRNLARGLESAAMEAVRNGRGVLSSLQTVANLAKSEAEFGRTGPERGP